jgi:hypothetical protein
VAKPSASKGFSRRAAILKRSWILAVIVFGGALALANSVLVPLYCRGEFAIPLLERANHCLAQSGLTRSSSMLLYFGVVALALFVGIVFDKLPRRASAAAEAKADAVKPGAEPVEQAAVATPTPSVAPTPSATAEAPKAEAPKPDAVPPVDAAKADAPKPDAAPAAAETPAEAPKVDLAAVIEAALKSNAPLPSPVLPKPAPASVVTPPAVPKPAPMPSVSPPPVSASSTLPPAPVLPPPPKPTPIPKPWQKPKPFDGTNEELIARFKDLAKEGGVEAIAAAQRNLDESTLAALGGGVDPKQHLSQIAHLLLIEDPDLKSEVTRGVIVHIAARLKELGVVTNLAPGGSA